MKLESRFSISSTLCAPVRIIWFQFRLIENYTKKRNENLQRKRNWEKRMKNNFLIPHNFKETQAKKGNQKWLDLHILSVDMRQRLFPTSL